MNTHINSTHETEETAESTLPRKGRDTSLSDIAYETLLGEVISLAINPGAHLRIKRLTDKLKMSQTPVRAALMRLEAEGIVCRTHNAGFTVQQVPSAQKIKELHMMRSLLEPAAAELAAIKSTREDLYRIIEKQEMLSKLHKVQSAVGPLDVRLVLLDKDFHHEIARVSGNSTLYLTLNRLHAHINIFRASKSIMMSIDAINEHWAIVDAIDKRDPAEANHQMKLHLENSFKRLQSKDPEIFL